MVSLQTCLPPTKCSANIQQLALTNTMQHGKCVKTLKISYHHSRFSIFFIIFWLEQQTHNLEVPGSSPGWSTNRFQEDVKQYVILAFKTRIIAVKPWFYSGFLFIIHICLMVKTYLLIVIIRSFSATEIAT